MERSLTVEERIKRAESIYLKRHGVEENEYTRNKNKEKRKNGFLFNMFKKIIKNVIYLGIIALFILHINGIIDIQKELNNINKVINENENVKWIRNNMENIQKYIEEKEKKKEKDERNIDSKKQINNEKNKEENKSEVIEEKQENIGGAEIQKEEIVETKIVKDMQEKEVIFIKPIEGDISSRFGWRESNNPQIPKNHTGIDIKGKVGDKIKSSTDGKVLLVSDQGGYGKHIKIQSGKYIIIYAHCSKIYVKEGEKVKRGQEIAEVGNTGNSTGPHLHFEVRENNVPIDPEKIIKIRGG